MVHDREARRSERGIALVVAVLVLVFLSLLASAFLVSINVETKIAGRTARTDRALNVAEAGIAEAVERIRKGDVPDNDDPKMVSVIFLDPAGSVPSVGTDTIPLPTYQDPSNWLSYSTTNNDPDMLTVRYKTDANRKVIYKYDVTKTPMIQTSSGQPIFVVTATGRVGDSKRTIVAEVASKDIQTNCKGGIASGKMVQFIKDVFVCGYDHSGSTPTWTGVPKGRSTAKGGCIEDLSNKWWETGSTNIVGAWSGGKVQGGKHSEYNGFPAPTQENQVGFYTGPWDVLNMTQTQFWTLCGQPVTSPGTLSGKMDGVRLYKGSMTIKGGDGEGLLYVDGDVQVKGDFTYRGLIYCTGKFFVWGKTWILGSVISVDKLQISAPDNTVGILYSHDAIVDGINRFVGPIKTISWREMP